jgi:hypothetical protein
MCKAACRGSVEKSLRRLRTNLGAVQFRAQPCGLSAKDKAAIRAGDAKRLIPRFAKAS